MTPTKATLNVETSRSLKETSLAHLDASWDALASMAAQDALAHIAQTDDKDLIAEQRYAYLQGKWGELA